MACGTQVCDECPRPRLLDEAEFGVHAYLACRTQWNLAPSGRLLGLRYESCLPMLKHQRKAWREAGVLEVPSHAQLVADLQVVERAVIEAADEQRSDRAPQPIGQEE